MYYYSIFDLKARTFGDLIALPTDKHPAAIRWFSMVLAGKNAGMIKDHPEDFELHYIGEFDVETGDMNQDGKTFICSASDVIDEIATPKEVIDAEA